MDYKLMEYINGTIKRMEYARNHRQRTAVFVKYYNSFDIDNEELNRIVTEREPGSCVKIYEFSANYMYDICEPVLLWLRDIYYEYFKEESEEEFLRKCDVYPLHIDMIAGYFRNGECNRTEDIIVSEVEYESRQFMRSVVNVINYVSDRIELIFILSKIHLAPESICNLLWEIIDSGKCKKLVVIAGFNELYNVPQYMQNNWRKLIQAVNKANLVTEWDIIESRDLTDDERKTFTPRIDMAERYSIILNNLMTSLALGQAEYYADMLRIYHDVDDKAVISEDVRVNLIIVDAYISIYSANYKNAFQLCEKLRKFNYYARKIELQYEYNKLLVLTKVYGGQKESAYKNVVRCNELAIRDNNDKRIFESHVLRCIVELDGWRDVVLHDKDINLTPDFESKAYEYRWLNHLAYIYFFGFVDSVDIETTDNNEYIGCEKSPYFRKAMEISHELRNDEAMLNAWQKNIIISSTTGKFEATQYYYEKCLKILKHYNRECDEAQLYNGAGYYCIVREEFYQANTFFKKAIEIFTRVEEPYLECETLYNMAINAMAAGEYEEVIKCLKITIEITKMLHKERIRIANISKLYGMLTVSFIQLEREYDAKLYLDKMTNVLRHLLDTDTPDYTMWEDDMFLYYLACGMLARRENRLDDAERMFKAGERIWRMQPINQFFVFGMYVYECALLYRTLGRKNECERIVKVGLDFFGKTKQNKKYSKLEARLNDKEYVMDKIGNTITKDKYNKVIDMVEKHALKINLADKKKTMTFFENWVELLNSESDSIELMTERAMAAMENTYNIDKLIYLEIENGISSLKYCDRNFPVSGNQIKGILSYFNKYEKSVIVSRFDNDYDRYDELTDIFGKNEIFSIIGIPIIIKNRLTSILICIRTKHENFTQGIEAFNEEELNVFKTTFRQLLDAITRENIKLQLEKSSVTDLLTGLLNRQGFKKKLESLLKGYSQTLTMLYMDLDNFKYCNDHFGHEAGDSVLIAFSRMLEKVAGNTSIITRYGGDEFVIVLPNKDVTDGINVAENIFREISQNRGFEADIKRVFDGEVNIPENNRVTCSIGIASDICINYEDISGILMKADDALYKVKNSTKSNYEVWQ